MRRAALALVLCGCSRACDRPSQAGEDASELSETAEAGAPTLAPERCAPFADPVALDKSGGGEVIGDVVLVGNDLYIATVRHGVASIGKTTLALGAPVWTDLGQTLGDAPPPELVTSGGLVYALFWERAEAGSSRTLVVVRLPSGERVWTMREDVAAESMGIDAAFSGPGGLVVWDGADGVRAGFLQPGKPVVARALSATGVMGSSARVLPREEDGYVVIWAERKIDTFADGAAKTQPGDTIEAPGEGRTFEWLTLMRLDLGGQPRGAPRRITSETGHISQLDLVSTGDNRFDIYARDGADTLGGEVGGRVLRFSVHGDQVDSPVEVVGGGVGGGAPSVVVGSRGKPWLFFQDALERARALPIGAPDGRPSLEPALDDVRVEIPLPDEGWLGVSAARALVQIRCRAASQGFDALQPDGALSSSEAKDW